VVPLLPRATLMDGGLRPISKTGIVTVRFMVVIAVMPPPIAVTVIVYVPAAVVWPTLIVIVELPEPGADIGLGLNVTLVPVGTPAADSETAELKPLLNVVTVAVFE
jgi:hypothetical protein